MRHTGGPLRRAVSMVVPLETYGLEARFWTVQEAEADNYGCPNYAASHFELYFAVAFAVVVKVIAVSAWTTASSLPVAAAAPVPAPAPVPIRAPLPPPARPPMSAPAAAPPPILVLDADFFEGHVFYFSLHTSRGSEQLLVW